LLSSVALAGVALALAPRALAQTAAGEGASAARPAAHFMIRAFQVKGNHWLAPGDVEEIVYPFMGPGKTAQDVEHARAALQKAFETAGYATVAVFIPEQSVDTGVIRLEVQPQSIGRVTVTGKGDRSRLLAQAPSLRPGTVPNFQAVQRDVVALNQQADRRVTPEVTAGQAPGTIDVNLKVEQSPPWHGSLEFNNDRSPDTTPYRVLGTVTYADLWGHGDSVSLSAQTAPERPSDATVFSANYLTHVGRVQLLGYYVYSDSDIAVVGGTTVIGKGNMAGVRLILPISQSSGFYQSFTAGIDWKDFGENVRLGADTSNSPITYFPVTLGWRGDWTGKISKSDLSITTAFGLRGLGDDQAAFDAKRFNASPSFFVLKGEASHTQDLPSLGDAQAYVHVSGQWSADPLVSNEEFSIGGLSTVRGYDESELLGDYGAAIQTELRTPNLVSSWSPAAWLKPDELRVHAFIDAGWEGIHDPLPGQTGSAWLSSVGLGATARLGHANGVVEVGEPLVAGPNTKIKTIFARFRLWGDF
jgi:hemolysin activation/secretion protein